MVARHEAVTVASCDAEAVAKCLAEMVARSATHQRCFQQYVCHRPKLLIPRGGGGGNDDDKVAVVTLLRLPVTLAHNCCKRQLQAEERRNG